MLIDSNIEIEFISLFSTDTTYDLRHVRSEYLTYRILNLKIDMDPVMSGSKFLKIDTLFRNPLDPNFKIRSWYGSGRILNLKKIWSRSSRLQLILLLLIILLILKK